MRNTYHKKPLTQPNKVLEGLNLQKPVQEKIFWLGIQET